jgi:HlyD family secretion protein
MKRGLWIVIILALLLGAGFAVMRMNGSRALAQQAGFETQAARRGTLRVAVSANGVVRPAQTALLAWGTTGTLASVHVQMGDRVPAGKVLAELEQTSLPRSLILAQADLIHAQRLLDDLLISQSQSAQAQKDLEEAEHRLEDALNPGVAQAQAQTALVQAQKALETARRNLEISLSPDSPQAVEAAYNILLLWDNRLKRTKSEIERVQRQLTKDDDAYETGESRGFYEIRLKSLLLQLVGDQRAAEDAAQRYQNMLQPPDPTVLAQAQADLALAQAQLLQAQTAWERLRSGFSPAEIAVLQAQVDDARRRWERLKVGPDPAEVEAARSRVTAAEAAVGLQRLAAPFAGVITQVNNLPGDQIEPGSLAFRLDDLSTLLVELPVSEVDVNRLQVGQPASITLDSVPGVVYDGEVVAVSQVGSLAGGVAQFHVKVKVIDADGNVRPAMTALAQIVITELEDVLLAPARAVRFLDGQRVLYVLRVGKLQPVEISLGLASDEEVQVTGGDLQPGDLVVLNPPLSPEQ